MTTLQPSNLGASSGAPRANFDRSSIPPATLKRRVWEADPEGGMQEMFEPATFVGLGAVAVWVHFRYPRLRPGSLVRAIAHVAASFGGFALLPAALSVLLPLLSTRASQVSATLALLFVTLTYVFVSWVWLIARILNDVLGGKPRGGHPVSAES
jgi:hypothetical protein